MMTVTLFGGMILQNFIYVGVFICWLHNMNDVFITISRVLSQTIYKTSTIVTFIFAVLMWILFRNILLPITTIEAFKSLIYPAELAHM